MHNFLNPKLNIKFNDLYNLNGLTRLNKKFNQFLQQKNPQNYQKFLTQKTLPKKDQDAVIIETARLLEDFLVDLFCIKKENDALKNEHKNLQILHFIKREFVQRIVAKRYNQDSVALIKYQKPQENVLEFEKNFAKKICELLDKNLNLAEQKEFDALAEYAVIALYNQDAKRFHEEGVLFKLPQKIDHQKLFDFEKNGDVCHAKEIKERDGFNLTDQGFNLAQALTEAHYCIFCHKQEKDSCRTGIKENDTLKKDHLNLELHGCPLDQKISEMNLLKSEGRAIASLAIAIIDNPLLAGTGHRICNDCMKSCIFQKQDPVNIPQIESENLKDVLKLPYGFEIYSLLTRWHPLNLENPLPQKKSGKKILVAGLGPAGYTLSHYLLNDGHDVVAIDGLKIEPLDETISGINIFGKRKKFKPIKFLDEIYEPLQNRAIQGFGGVAEYGITARWDKNFLKIIRLLLERRDNFRMFGGVRFGSSITDKIAFDDYGFDHIALCLGAGRPNIIDLKNNYAKGVRSASDFLMSLHLGGAFKKESLVNLQIRMPIIVIGAGLTAVDAACEAQEYYFAQIKKFSTDFFALGREKVFANLNEEEKIIAEEFLEDAQILENQGRKALLKKYSDAGNGAKILYRKKIQDSPAYRLNHYELQKAFEEGVEFVENASPTEIILDEFGHIKSLKAGEKIFPCKSLLIAAGTSPNVSIALEDKLDFTLEGKYFKPLPTNVGAGFKPALARHNFLTKIDKKGRAISFFGDLHPQFEGSVVKAMASAKFGHVEITKILNSCPASLRAALSLPSSSQPTLASPSSLRAIFSPLSSLRAALAPPASLRAAFSLPSSLRAALAAWQSSFFLKLKRIFLCISIIDCHAAKAARNDESGERAARNDGDENYTNIKFLHLWRFLKNFLKSFFNSFKNLFKEDFFTKINNDFLSTIHEIKPLSSYVLQISVHSPLIAKQTRIGQIFRLQNFNFFASKASKPIPLTALNIKNDIITAIATIQGASTSLLKNLRKGEPLIFMGPSGKPTEIAKDETVLLIGGGRGIMPLIAIAEIYKKNNCKIIFAAGYQKKSYILAQKQIEKFSDVAIFTTEKESPNLKLRRPQDQQYQGLITEGLQKYLAQNPQKIDRIFTIGNNKMMAEIARLRHENPQFTQAKIAITSLNAPMQCMMKGVCSQCLQKKIVDGKTQYFYSCAAQDQNIDELDFKHLHARCEMNSLQEKIAAMMVGA